MDINTFLEPVQQAGQHVQGVPQFFAQHAQNLPTTPQFQAPAGPALSS